MDIAEGFAAVQGGASFTGKIYIDDWESHYDPDIRDCCETDCAQNVSEGDIRH